MKVAVIGLGAMGSAAAWRLACRDLSVIAFERFDPANAYSSSHGESRAIRTAYAEGSGYVPLALEAFDLWRSLEAETGTPILTTAGVLECGPSNGSLVHSILASAHAYALAHDVMDASTLRDRFPQFSLRDDHLAIYHAKAGFLRPEAAVHAMVTRAESLGAGVLRSTAVEGLSARSDGVVVRAGGQTSLFDHAVVAVGPWLPEFLPGLGFPLTIERQVSAWFAVRDPLSFSPERCPPYGFEIDGGWRYGFPTLDGVTVKVAVHHEGAATTAHTVDRTIHADDLAPLEAFVRECLVGVEPYALRGDVCLYTNTPDEHFLIGIHPALPRVTIISACSGHGFKFAPVIGEIAADYVLHGGTDRSATSFDVDRFR